MQLATLDINPETAKANLNEYRAALKQERDVEDEAIAAAYRAAARGLPVISLTAAITAGGFFDNGLPRIAISRAGTKQCTVERDGWSEEGVTYSDERATGNAVRALVGSYHVRVRVALPSRPTGSCISCISRRGSTVVPPIPPRHRPNPRRLARFHILWEVEKWDPTPPHDPALLRHIRGDLWAVMATWDLTDIERHVLAQRGRT